MSTRLRLGESQSLQQGPGLLLISHNLGMNKMYCNVYGSRTQPQGLFLSDKPIKKDTRFS